MSRLYKDSTLLLLANPEKCSKKPFGISSDKSNKEKDKTVNPNAQDLNSPNVSDVVNTSYDYNADNFNYFQSYYYNNNNNNDQNQSSQYSTNSDITPSRDHYSDNNNHNNYDSEFSSNPSKDIFSDQGDNQNYHNDRNKDQGDKNMVDETDRYQDPIKYQDDKNIRGDAIIHRSDHIDRIDHIDNSHHHIYHEDGIRQTRDSRDNHSDPRFNHHNYDIRGDSGGRHNHDNGGHHRDKRGNADQGYQGGHDNGDRHSRGNGDHQGHHHHQDSRDNVNRQGRHDHHNNRGNGNGNGNHHHDNRNREHGHRQSEKYDTHSNIPVPVQSKIMDVNPLSKSRDYHPHPHRDQNVFDDRQGEKSIENNYTNGVRTFPDIQSSEKRAPPSAFRQFPKSYNSSHNFFKNYTYSGKSENCSSSSSGGHHDIRENEKRGQKGRPERPEISNSNSNEYRIVQHKRNGDRDRDSDDQIQSMPSNFNKTEAMVLEKYYKYKGDNRIGVKYNGNNFPQVHNAVLSCEIEDQKKNWVETKKDRYKFYANCVEGVIDFLPFPISVENLSDKIEKSLNSKTYMLEKQFELLPPNANTYNDAEFFKQLFYNVGANIRFKSKNSEKPFTGEFGDDADHNDRCDGNDENDNNLGKSQDKQPGIIGMFENILGMFKDKNGKNNNSNRNHRSGDHNHRNKDRRSDKNSGNESKTINIKPNKNNNNNNASGTKLSPAELAYLLQPIERIEVNIPPFRATSEATPMLAIAPATAVNVKHNTAPIVATTGTSTAKANNSSSNSSIGKSAPTPTPSVTAVTAVTAVTTVTPPTPSTPTRKKFQKPPVDDDII